MCTAPDLTKKLLFINYKYNTINNKINYTNILKNNFNKINSLIDRNDLICFFDSYLSLKKPTIFFKNNFFFYKKSSFVKLASLSNKIKKIENSFIFLNPFNFFFTKLIKLHKTNHNFWLLSDEKFFEKINKGIKTSRNLFFYPDYLIFLINNKTTNLFLLSIIYKISYKCFKNNLIIKKDKLFNIVFFKNFLSFLNDLYYFNDFKINFNFFSNKYLTNMLTVYDFDTNGVINQFHKNSGNKVFSNYYPVIFLDYNSSNKFFDNIKTNYNLNYMFFTNKLIISFFEFFFKKKIFIKIINNKFNDLNNYYLDSLLNEYKNFHPLYFKDHYFSDFLKILWYSFMLKDLKMLSEWISKFMETLNFKNHKKFINFFINFLNKYSGLFIDVLGVKGFFFDIRGKVGVTGSSKKRHICCKFGSLKKSSKNFKINFNQNLVRTYSGVLGLTYIISY